MMAFLLKAGKQIIGTSSKYQLLLPKPLFYSTLLKKPISSSANKTYEDMFAWVAADVHAYSRYTSLLARLCVSGPEVESQLPLKTEKSAEKCLLKMLENFSRKDLMNLLLCFLANNPEVLKVLFVGDINSSETISKTKLQITFPKMTNTIADECEAEWVYKRSRFRLKSEQDMFHVFVDVSDMEIETLVVFISGDLLTVTGKLTTVPTYDKEVEKDMIGCLYESIDQATGDVVASSRVYYKGHDLKQATGEILEGGELRISYPVVHEEVERPRFMQVIFNKNID